MLIKLERTDAAFAMQATNERQGAVDMDASDDIGGGGEKMRPMQLLLAALAGCSTIDVLHILAKQRIQLAELRAEVEGEREKVGECQLFRNIQLHFYARGEEMQL